MKKPKIDNSWGTQYPANGNIDIIPTDLSDERDDFEFYWERNTK